MTSSRLFALAATLVCLLFAPNVFAQTQNISSFSGNGQLICPSCTANGIQTFDPMVAKVTDANGAPLVGVAVNWTVTAGQGTFGGGGTTAQVFTDSNGQAQVSLFVTALNTTNTAQPFIQNVVVANTSTSSVSFFETQTSSPGSNSSSQGPSFVSVQDLTPITSPLSCPTCPFPGETVTGTAGSTAAQQLKFFVYTLGGSVIPTVPNVAIRLISNQTTPSASCATGAGADPGSVLTDANGFATCNIILGPAAGFGSFFAVIGGTAQSLFGAQIGYVQTGNYFINVLPGTPASLVPLSGNGQTANPSQPITFPLIAKVADQAGNGLAGQTVTWTVSPAGGATLNNTTTTSDSNGQVRTNATFSANAAGTVTIKATLTSNNALVATFTETANVQVTGLSIVSGNNQTAIVNAPFAAPLVVRLATSNNQATAGFPVTFNINGPGTLSSNSASTDANGLAQIFVTGTSGTGTVTVTATAGNFSQSFTLTVIPPGPTLTVNSFLNGADFQRGSISPCSIATIIAPGIAPALQGDLVPSSLFGPLPFLLGGDTVTFNNSQAPIYNMANINGQQQITVQVPCDVTPGPAVRVTVNVSGGSGTITVPVLPASPGIFGTPQANGTLLPVLVRPDGSFVTAQNPARRGETVIAYVTGMGPTTPAVGTDSLPVPNGTAAVQGTVIVGYGVNGIPFTFARLSEDMIGVSLVAFQIPTGSATGNVNFSVAVIPPGSSTPFYSALGVIPVQ